LILPSRFPLRVTNIIVLSIGVKSHEPSEILFFSRRKGTEL